jgi:hypothetical protein
MSNVTPPERIYLVPADNRKAPIATDNRTYSVPDNE